MEENASPQRDSPAANSPPAAGQPPQSPAFPDSSGRPPVERKIARSLAALIVVSLTSWLCGHFAFALMFSGFHTYDDEGAALMVLHQLAHGHILYDQIASQYGPIGFLPKYALIRLLHLPVSHDTGRSLVLIYWLLSSALLGLATWRLNGSAVWFGIGAAAACLVLGMIVFEPGHPQDMCCLLLSLAVLVCTFGGVNKIARIAVILSILGGLLAMTKINLAAFYFAALGAALIYRMSPTRLRTQLLCALAIALVISPILLMYPTFPKGWSVFYATEISLALIACLTVATTMPATGNIRPRDILRCACFFLLTVLVISVITISMGTSLQGLADGIIFLPLLVSKSFIFSQGTYGLAVIASACGLALAATAAVWIRRVNPPSPAMTLIIGLFRILAGLVVLWCIWTAHRWAILIIGPGFAWLLLLPVRRTASADQSFARVFLAFLAILEAMWAFPVSGTQLAFAIFLLAIGGIVILADGISDLSTLIRRSAIAAAMPRAIAFGTFCCLFVATLPLRSQAISTYEKQVPLDLPGSHWIHLPPQDAQNLQLITNNLLQNADVFYTMPGMNSFYFWTATEPPTSTNLQQWMYLLNDRQQRQVLQALSDHPRACALINRGLCDFWMQDASPPRSPLLQYYFGVSFRPAIDLGDWTLWVRTDRTRVTKILPDRTQQVIHLTPPQQ